MISLKETFNKKKSAFCGLNDMAISTPSKWLANLVKGSFLKTYPIHVINNGINLLEFRPTVNSFKKERRLEKKKSYFRNRCDVERTKGSH